MNDHTLQMILSDARYAQLQLRQFRDVRRALDAIDRIVTLCEVESPAAEPLETRVWTAEEILNREG